MNLDPPSVTAPSATTVQVGTTVELTFTYSAPAGFTSSAVTGATVTTDGTADATSGSIVVSYTAPNTPGGDLVTVEVTDAEGDKDEASVPITVSVSPVPTLTGIPPTATLVIGQELVVPDVSIDSEDGIATFTVTINGGTPLDLLTLLGETGGAGLTELMGDLEADTDDELFGFVEGNNTLVFSVTDTNGDEVTVTHILTLESLGFDIVDIIDDMDTDDEADDVLVAREITGSINSNFTMTNDAEWILAGRIKVTNGAKLTIEAGSVLKGREGTGGNATALLVARGSTIFAEGTATAPIIMTSINDDLSVADVAAGDFVGSTLAPDVNGQWGGLIVLGDAPISASADEVQIEGIPTSDPDGLYGGTNASHSAGTIKYVSVRHGGSLIGAGNEINGISLGGVGSGTVIENVEVVGNQDDGIEWFGGNVDIDGALVWNAGDDAMDTDQDWQGTCSNFLVVTPLGSAFELDGPEGPDARDGGVHTFNVGTVFAGGDIDHLVDWDGTTNAALTNIYFFGLQEGYWPFDDDGDQIFAIDAIGGDGNGTSSDWEVTLPGADTKADIFVDDDADTNDAAFQMEVSEVDALMNTVGINNGNIGMFAWTYAAQDGGLTAIGYTLP